MQVQRVILVGWTIEAEDRIQQMKRPRASDFKHQMFRSTAMRLAKEFLMASQVVLAKRRIDARCISYEPIIHEALGFP
ncbi:hypothetical protein [Pseudomonas putida]